jgi:serine/threonine protein kinase SCH9
MFSFLVSMGMLLIKSRQFTVQPGGKFEWDRPQFNPDHIALDYATSLTNKTAALAVGLTWTPATLGIQVIFNGFTFIDERALDGHAQRYGAVDEEKEQGSDGEEPWKLTNLP